ncbi:DUF2778 domain-containing protein, partial [Burkholderia gladioli]|nr:tlde1 domain-containing protein [Burkholderia gladioli]
MPVECTFVLNKQSLPTLHCTGFGSVSAFSGNGRHINNPDSVAVADKGSLPPRIYDIVDRQSGDHLGGSGTA